MANLRLQEMSPVTDGYHRSLDIYLSHFGRIVGTTLIPQFLFFLLLLSFLATYYSGLIAIGDETTFFRINNIYFLLSILIVLTMAVVQTIGVAAMTYMVNHHENVTVVHAFTHSFKFFWRFLVYALSTVISMGIGLLAGYFILLGIGVVMGFFSFQLYGESIVVLNYIPTLLSAVTGAFTLFGGFRIVDKDVKAWDGIKYSILLVRKHFWPVAVRVVIFTILTAVLGILLALIPWIGKLLALLTIVPFTVVYLYALYEELDTLNTHATGTD